MTAISRFCRFILVVALWIGGALLSIAPLQAAITAQDFESFSPDALAESLAVPGADAINGAGQFTIQDFSGFYVGLSGQSLFNADVGGGSFNAGATLTIDFTQPQISYRFTRATNASIDADFTVQLYMIGSPDVLDTDQVPVLSGPQVVTQSYPGAAVFNRMVFSSTAEEWGIDDLDTVDATPGIVYLPTGGSTDLSEGGPTDSYLIALSSPPTSDVTVTITPDAQCNVLPTTLTFTPANYATGQSVVADDVDDAVSDVDPCIVSHVTSVDPVTGDPAYDGLTTDISIPVTDNDTAGVTFSSTSLNVAEGANTSYTVVLDSQPATDVTISLNTDLAQCSLSPSSVTFTNGTWNFAQPITVTAVDDTIDETSQNCVITHTPSGDSAYASLTLSDVTVTITGDNDVAAFNVSPVSLGNIPEIGSSTYNIKLDTQPIGVVVVNLVSSTPSDCTVLPAQITLDANWSTGETITVAGVNNAVADGTRTCTITHTVDVGTADLIYAGLSLPDVSASVIDDDVAGVTLSKTTVSISESGTTDTYTIAPDTEPLSDLTIDLSILPASQCLVDGVASKSVTFLSGSTTPQTITVSAVDDVTDEGAHSCTISHTISASGADYTAVTIGDVVANIADNDAPLLPVYSSSPAPLTPITVPATTAGTPSTATVTISEAGNATLDITGYSITGGPELSVSSSAGATFSIADGGANVDLTITCDSVTAATYTGTLTVNHNAAGSPATYAVSCVVNAAAAPVYSSSPAPLTPITVPATTAGTPSTATVTINEAGNATLDITSYSITGGPELSVSSSAGATFSIADGGASVDLTITCDSATAATYTGTLTVNHNAAGSPATYAVSCVVNAAAAPVYSSSPALLTPITVPATTAGTPSTATVTINEAGNATLDITGYSITGGPELSVSSSAGATFSIADGGASVDLTITCDSATAATYTGTLTVNHNAAGSPATYAVSCVVNAAAAPVYSSSPAPLTPITVPATTAGVLSTATVTISEAGNATLDITGYSITGGPELTVSGPTAPFNIADNGASVVLTINCLSATAATYTGTLTVNHNASGSPASYPVSCVVGPPLGAGYGSVPAVGGTIVINTTTAAPASTNLQVLETGNAALTISSYSVTGGPALTVSTSSFTINDGGAAVNIPVQCSSAVVGTYTGTLTVNHNASGSPATYPVTCNVSAAPPTPAYSSNPSPGSTLQITTSLGTGASGTIRVTNTGTGTLNITNIVLGASAQLSLVSSPTVSVLSGQSTDISIQCAASAIGNFTASLVVTHSASGSPANYTVRCDVAAAGAAYGSTPAPNSVIDVGTVLIGTAISNNLTIFETGGAALSINTALISGSGEFTISAGAPPFTIPDGGSARSITITCIPTSVGLRTALLTITTNVPTQAVVTYSLACTGSSTAVVTPTPIGFVASPTPPPGPTVTVFVPATGQVQGVTGLAIRTGPYLGATLIGVLRPGTPHSILGMNSDEGLYTWYLVEVNGKQGWVSGRFLEVSGTTSAIPSVGSIFDQIDNSPDIGVRVRTDAIIDLRRRPSPRMPSIAVIPAGADLIVIGRSVQEKQTFWIHVVYNGTVGWIPSLPVGLRGPVDSLPTR